MDRCQSPLTSRYRDLFKLQGLTRIALALEFYSRIGAQSAEGHPNEDDMPRRALKCSEAAVDVILQQILAILDLKDHEKFEKKLRPSSALADQLKVFLNRGPGSLRKYRLLYGLLDCASQLGSIMRHHYPPEFEARMMSIIVRSEESSFRWKAVSNLIP
jgi:hypothetical protein